MTLEPIVFSYVGTWAWSPIKELLNFSSRDQFEGAHKEAAPRKYSSPLGSINTKSSWTIKEAFFKGNESVTEVILWFGWYCFRWVFIKFNNSTWDSEDSFTSLCISLKWES